MESIYSKITVFSFRLLCVPLELFVIIILSYVELEKANMKVSAHFNSFKTHQDCSGAIEASLIKSKLHNRQHACKQQAKFKNIISTCMLPNSHR